MAEPGRKVKRGNGEKDEDENVGSCTKSVRPVRPERSVSEVEGARRPLFDSAAGAATLRANGEKDIPAQIPDMSPNVFFPFTLLPLPEL